MRIALSLLLAAALFTTGIAGCAEVPRVNVAAATPAEGDPQRPPDPALANAVNDFGFDLLRQVGVSPAAGARENVVVSPLSIHTVLTMTLNGARGKTAEEMASVLHLDSLGRERANAAYADLLAALDALDSSTETTLTVANSLWPDTEFDMLREFVDTNRRFFGAQVEQIDLGAPDAADRMNSWIAEQTAGDITELIDEVPAGMLYLINAVHVDAAWDEPFDPDRTRDGEFSDGRTAFTVPFLNRTTAYRYSHTSYGQAIRLPTKDGRLGVWVLAPPHPNYYKGGMFGGFDFAAVLDDTILSIDAEAWREITGAAEERDVILALPKLDLRYRTELKEDLKSMGMPSAFELGADLSGIGVFPAELPSLIGGVLHETSFVLDEEGARASAVTAVEAEITSAPIDQVTMIVDRPFLIAIEDEPSGALLFLGAIYDPR